jgi:hypothetical protein
MALGTYDTAVLADQPIGYWRLGEAPGSAIAADASGHGNHGNYSSVGITLGQPGFHGGDTAALFDGATGRIVVPNSETLNPRNITMEAKVSWFGPNPGRIQYLQRILEKSSYEQRAEYALNIDEDGHVFVDLRVRTALGGLDVNVSAKSRSVVAQRVETHIVATFDGKEIKIYLNGALDSQTPLGDYAGDLLLKFPSPPPPSLDGYLGIGNQTYPSRPRPFYGLIDEVVVYATALSAERVLAHYQSQFAEQVTFQYAVKFVCGNSPGTVVAPGAYFTAINVHNPTYRVIGFRAKIAVALPGLTPGPVSKFFDARLGPDEALEIDCSDIFKHAETRADFLKGFVVIETDDVELDVVAVYTAAGRDGQVTTLHSERVPPRRREVGVRKVCVDFEPPLAVGTEYGAPAGHSSGDVVFTTNGVPVSVHGFSFPGSGGAFGVARIELAPVPFGSGQSIRTSNINLEFDFSKLGFQTSQVQFEVLDLGGLKNLSVNGSPVFAGDLSLAPSLIAGVSVAVSMAPVSGGNKGTVTLTGAVQRLGIGGQELWIDNVCARQ